MRFVLACSLVLLAGCPAATSIDAGAAAAQFCLDWQRVAVEHAASCGAYSSTEGFLEAAGACTLTAYQRFDPVKAKTCLDSFTNRACGAVGSGACSDVITGTRGESDPCFEGECLPELVCDQSSGCPGTCLRRLEPGALATRACVEGAAEHDGVCVPRVALGESCLPPAGSMRALPCVYDAVCGPDGRCIPFTRGDAGAFCQYELGLYCGDGLQCLGDGCLPLARPGEACGGDRQCQYDLTCEGTTCVAPGDLGAACQFNLDCRATLFCGVPEGEVAGTCMTRKTAGQTCFVGGSQCARSLTCVLVSDPVDSIGRCEARAARGAACTRFDEEGFCQPGLYCSANALNPEGTCVDTRTSGKCDRWQQCQSGWCEADGGCQPSCFAPAP